MGRLPSITPDRLSDEQQRLFDRITGGARSQGRGPESFLDERRGLRGPFNAWMYSPALGDRAQALGEAVRFAGELSARLRELAILVVAADWRAQYEWWAHARIGRDAGLSEALLESLRSGRRPQLERTDEVVVYDFVRELLETRRVCAATYTRAVDALGESGTVELVLLVGYYTLVSMTLNTFEVPVPRGEATPFPP